MKRIGILGDIGSGKSYVARKFGYPVFDADQEVHKIYKKEKRIFLKLKRVLPNYFSTFPLNKNEVSNAIVVNDKNLKKIVKVIHPEIRKKLNIFINKNKKRKIVVLDIPLLLENKIDKKNDILVFVNSKKKEINKRLRKRKNFNQTLFRKFKKIQLSLDHKKRKSNFIINNKFTEQSVKVEIRRILNKVT
tara:strand:- start:1522 stop:2091 length:570 start_codon:yes stop_codon:yes gene_type:complete